MPFGFHRLRIPEVILIEATAFEDDRGFFFELYRQSEFARFGISHMFVQDNVTRSRRGVVRGLHYQKPPQAQAKLVSVRRGEVFDVAVDVRKGSPTCGQWVGEVLSASNRLMLFIPVGFAHGYCALHDDTHVLYKVTAEYAPELDRGIAWNDPVLAIRWPVESPIVSQRDTRLPRLIDADNPFVYEESPQ